jgi:hypothetical protein
MWLLDAACWRGSRRRTRRYVVGAEYRVCGDRHFLVLVQTIG